MFGKTVSNFTIYKKLVKNQQFITFAARFRICRVGQGVKTHPFHG